MKLLGLVLGTLHCVTAALIVPNAPKFASSCRNISFTVQASATNIIVDKPLDSDLSSTEKVNAYLQAVPITVINGLPGKRGGTFKLAALYCIPTFPASRFEGRNSPIGDIPLQILLHGSTCKHSRRFIVSYLREMGDGCTKSDRFVMQKMVHE